jgi:N-carbamoylputrescine amidase
MAEKFSVGLVQMACSPDPRENLEKAEAKVEAAARAGARVICLPELFGSRYFCQREDPALFDLAEPVPGPTTEQLGRAARRLGVAIIAPVFERRAPGLYHNTPGDLGFPAFATRASRVAALICWDQWYPEGARLAALAGASVLFYPTAIGWHPHEKVEHGEAQREAWRTVQRGHAIANGLYVAAVNRVGHEGSDGGGAGIEFWGSSFVADPQGIVVAEASSDREEVLLASVDPARIEDVRRNWPFLRDRRIDAYSGITRRFLDEDPWADKT